jgi:hypothetical protein
VRALPPPVAPDRIDGDGADPGAIIDWLLNESGARE